MAAVAPSAGEPPDADDVESQFNAAIAMWRTSGEFSEQTLLRSEETARRFARRLAVQGVQEVDAITAAHCHGFATAMTSAGRPPELATQHARRVAMRMLFRSLRELGHNVGDPTMDLRLPPRTARTARPLTDAEVTLCRTATRLGLAGSASLQRAVAWALAEATAMTSEISAIRLDSLDNPHHPRYVNLPGTRRVEPRLGELTDWGAVVLARQAQLLHDRRAGSATLLTYRGTGTPGQHVAQASICNAIAAVLDAAGLSEEPDVRPSSVRNWAARRCYDAGMPLERVARRLGARSLDAVADDIALDWQGTE